MFYFFMNILMKLNIAIGSRTFKYRLDEEIGEEEFNIWRSRLTYAWHLQSDQMTYDAANFTEFISGYIYSPDEMNVVTLALNRAWTKKDEPEFLKQEFDVIRLKRIAMYIYIYRLVRFPLNYFYSFFINLEGVTSAEMFDTYR